MKTAKRKYTCYCS